MNTSEVLNKAADLIEERGWIKGTGWPTSADGSDGQPLCLEGGIMAALGLRMTVDEKGRGIGPDGIDALTKCPAYAAVRDYLTWSDDLWAWNDEAGRTANEVIEILRAAAVIEASRERQTVEARP